MKYTKIAVAIVTIAAIGGFVWTKVQSSKNRSQVTYKVALATKQEIKKTVSSSGTLQPWTTVDVKSKAGGKIELLAVELGSVVKKGQIVAKIDPSDSLLTYSQSLADKQSASASRSQSSEAYTLQLSQTDEGIAQAYLNLQSAKENQKQAAARLSIARSEKEAQPAMTGASLNQATAAYEAANLARRRLDTTQKQSRANAKATFDQARANYKADEAAYARQKLLLDKGYVSRQSVEAAEAKAESTKATLDAAKTKLDSIETDMQIELQEADAQVKQSSAQLESAKAGSYAVKSKADSLVAAEAAYAQAKAQVAQADSQYREATAGKSNSKMKQLAITIASANSARADATFKNAKETLDQTVVRAPSDGVVLQKYVEQGTMISSGMSFNSSGTSIVQIGEISRMYVDVSVDETDIGSIAVGQNVEVSFDAFPGVPFKGQVAKINPQAETSSNVTTVHVRVEVDNSHPEFKKLKPAMNATCDFVVGEANNALAVPTEAIQTDGDKTFVEVVVGGKEIGPQTLVAAKTERREVKTGIDGSETTEIVSGLREGDCIVVSKSSPTDGESSDDSEDTDQKKAAFGGGGPGGPGGPPPGPPPGGGGGK